MAREPIRITVIGDMFTKATGIGSGKSQERLPMGTPGMFAPGVQEFSREQIDMIGVDSAGRGPTISQMAQAGIDAIGGSAFSDAMENASAASQSIAGGGPVGRSGPAAIGWGEELLQRAAIIILGFIFVAVGLSMFSSGKTLVQTITAPVRDGTKKAKAAGAVAAEGTA